MWGCRFETLGTNKQVNKQTNKKWNFQFPQPDMERRYSNEQVLFFYILWWSPHSFLNFPRYIKWEKARKPLSIGRKWRDYLPCCHVTDLISEQVSDFGFGHWKCLFWSEEKQWKYLFLTLKTVSLIFSSVFFSSAKKYTFLLQYI